MVHTETDTVRFNTRMNRLARIAERREQVERRIEDHAGNSIVLRCVRRAKTFLRRDGSSE